MNTDSKFHTVIFDLDGTLSDSTILTMAALERVTPALNLPVPSAEAVRSAMGYANPEFYYRLFPDFPRDIVRKAGNLVEQEELVLLPRLKSKLLFEGCRELLERLKEHDIRLCVASTGDSVHVLSVLGATGIIDFFDTVSCGVPDKVEMLREMANEGDKAGYVMVGDMKKDCDGARANGILSVGACYGYCERNHTDFDLYIDTPLDLLHIL